MESNSSLFFTASTSQRLNAYFLDSMILFFFKVLFLSLLLLWKGLPFLSSVIHGEGSIDFLKSFILNTSVPYFSVVLLFFLVLEILSFTYHWFFLAFYGATPGKMIFDLRVVLASKEELAKEGLGILPAFIRVFSVTGFQFFISFAYAAFALLNPQRIHLGDKIAGTKVIQKKPLPKTLAPRPLLGWGGVVFFLFCKLSSFLALLLSYRLSF